MCKIGLADIFQYSSAIDKILILVGKLGTLQKAFEGFS